MKVELNNRTLWFDGTIEVNPEMVPELFLGGVLPERIAITEESADTKQFNQFSEEQLTVGKKENRPFSKVWLMPRRYIDMDLEAYVLDRLGAMALACHWSNEKVQEYGARIKVEMTEIKTRGMEELVKALIYVMDELTSSKTVWGVGRGSSCASLVLFIIGLHKVDPIKYGIAMTEFFHD